MLLLRYIISKPHLVLAGEELGAVCKLSYLGSCIEPCARLPNELSSESLIDIGQSETSMVSARHPVIDQRLLSHNPDKP